MTITELRPSILADREYPDILVTAQDRLLNEVLDAAVSHDTKCQWLSARIWAGLCAKPVERETIDWVVNLQYEVVALCVRLLPAAQNLAARLDPLAGELVKTTIISELDEAGLDQFLRPVFEASGMGDRFEPRHKYEVYPAPDNAT